MIPICLLSAAGILRRAVGTGRRIICNSEARNSLSNIQHHANCAAAMVLVFALTACQSSAVVDLVKIDPNQGSEANIASLTEVIEKNPNSAEAFNVRGTAYGRAGRNREAIADFTHALQLNPRFYKAYANRAWCIAR